MNDKQNRPDVTAFREGAGAADLFLLCTPAGRVRYASGGLRRLIEEDLTGRNLNDFLPDDQVARLISDAMAGRGAGFRCEIRDQLFRCDVQPWEDAGGMQINLFPVNRSGRKLEGAYSARRVAQEINNNIAVLLPALQMLEENTPNGQEQYLSMARLHLFRLIRMARNLEDMAMVESGLLQAHLQEEDLTILCAELMERAQPFCHAMGIELQVRLPQQPLRCWVDKDKLQRIVLNLMANAMAVQPDGGVIAFSLRKREEDTVVLSVTDQGPGISGELLGKLAGGGILDRTVGEGGLGMGLALTRAFAEAHGGQLMLVSSEQGGLSARVMLPAGKPPCREVDQLHAWRSSYGTGLDLVKVELSIVARRELYLRLQAQKTPAVAHG